MSWKQAIATALLITATLSGCASVDEYSQPIKATPTPEPTPPKPEEQKKSPEMECRILNNEGRIFRARGSTRTEAEGKARRACQINYRHCTLLNCDLVMPEGS